MKTLPNIITWMRIGIIPVFVVFFYLPWGWARISAAGLFNAIEKHTSKVSVVDNIVIKPN